MAFDALNFLLKITGVHRSANGYHRVARAILVVLDLCTVMYIIHGSYTLSQVFELSEMSYLMSFTVASDAACATFIYIWGESYAQRHSRRGPAERIVTVMNVNLAISMIMLVVALKSHMQILLGIPGFFDIYFCPPCSFLAESYYPSVLNSNAMLPAC